MAPAVRPAALHTRAYSIVPTPRWLLVYVPSARLATIHAATIHRPTDWATWLTSFAALKTSRLVRPTAASAVAAVMMTRSPPAIPSCSRRCPPPLPLSGCVTGRALTVRRTTPHPRLPLVPYSRPAPPPRMASCEYAFSRSAFGKEVVKMFGRKDPGLSPCPIRPGLPHVPFHLPVCRVAPPARRPHGLGSSPAPVLGARGVRSAATRPRRAPHEHP